MGHQEQTKPTNIKNGAGRRSPIQKNRKYIKQNHRRKLPQPKERYTYDDKRSL